MGQTACVPGPLVHWCLADATECHEVTHCCRQTAGLRCYSLIPLVTVYGDLHSHPLILPKLPLLLRAPWLGTTSQGSGASDFEGIP